MNTIVARSWTIIQPTAVRAWRLSSSPRSVSTLITTSVELMAIAAPTTSAARGSRPSGIAAIAPTTVTITICRSAPGTTTRRTRASSRNENSTPSANSSRTTPSSARVAIRSTSPTKPGVNGPMTTPARM